MNKFAEAERWLDDWEKTCTDAGLDSGELCFILLGHATRHFYHYLNKCAKCEYMKEYFKRLK